jgi:hypothetical protein
MHDEARNWQHSAGAPRRQRPESVLATAHEAPEPRSPDRHSPAAPARQRTRFQPSSAPSSLGALLRSRRGLQQAMLLHEIVGPPVALRSVKRWPDRGAS